MLVGKKVISEHSERKAFHSVFGSLVYVYYSAYKMLRYPMRLGWRGGRNEFGPYDVAVLASVSIGGRSGRNEFGPYEAARFVVSSTRIDAWGGRNEFGPYDVSRIACMSIG